MQDEKLSGKVALVTGASSGIGLAVARKLAAAGARVALVARTARTLEEKAAEIGADRAAAFPCDVTDFARLAALPGEVVARLGRLDILVNNAGLNHRGPFQQHTPQHLAEVISTNLTAPIFLTRAVVDHMPRGGAIVNVASLAGYLPFGGAAPYCASKAGLRAFARAAAEDLAERGITVSTVSPGPVDTGFFGEDIAKVPDMVFSQPMRSADDVADAVLDCIREGTPEVALPALSGKLATLGYLFPRLNALVRPLLVKRGAKNKQRYMESKGAR
jgi:NAD(P)-dependent dehydrogenase (short-subunit alcohol dehydrogenase family)